MAEAKKKKPGKPRPQQKNPGLTPKQIQFLAAFEEVGSILRAAKIVGTSDSRHREWLHCSVAYREAFVVSKQIAMGKLEEEARRRAIEGIQRKKFFKGDPVMDPETGKQYIEHEYSDTLLMFLLRGGMPDVYRDRVSTEITGAAGQPLQIDHNVAAANLALLSREELDALEALTQKLTAPSVLGGDPAGASPAIIGPIHGLDQTGNTLELASQTTLPSS